MAGKMPAMKIQPNRKTALLPEAKVGPHLDDAYASVRRSGESAAAATSGQVCVIPEFIVAIIHKERPSGRNQIFQSASHGPSALIKRCQMTAVPVVFLMSVCIAPLKVG